jgi:hypothetical protein
MNQHDVPIHPTPPPMIEVKGSHREMGRQIGEACALQVRRSIENARALISSTYSVLELTWEGARIQASKYLPFAHAISKNWMGWPKERVCHSRIWQC